MRRRQRAGSLFVGFFLTGIGLLLFLQNLGLFRIRDILDWIVAILAMGWGVYTLIRVRNPFSLVVGGLAIAFGFFRILDVLGVIDFDKRYIPPFMLIGIGGAFLARAIAPGRTESSTNDLGNADSIGLQSVFGGVVRRLESQNFQGGEIFTMFGGVELDLRKSAIPPGTTATIDVHCMFGGVVMRVPETWSVDTRVVAVFGGVEDKSVGTNSGGASAGLILIGNVMFGGVEIKN